MDFASIQKQEKILLYLKQLGLSEIETTLYITILENSPISVRELTNKIHIKRTTAYFHVDALINKGLIKNSDSLLYALEPNKSIQKLVDDKIKLANKIHTSFPDMLKMISSLPLKNIGGVSEVKSYYGKNSVNNIFLDLLHAKEIRGFTNISEFLDIFPDTFQIVDKAIQQDKQKKYFEIVDNSPKTKLALQESVETTNNRYQCNYFPEDMKMSSSIVTIYDGKVSIVNTRGTLNGVILQSNVLYDNFKQLFDLIWTNISVHQ